VVVVHADNTATFYVGKTDCGQGTGTAFRQMMSDELDIASTRRAASWAALTSPSIRADLADRMRFRPTAGRCAPWRAGLGESSWNGIDAVCNACRSIAVDEGVITVKGDPSSESPTAN